MNKCPTCSNPLSYVQQYQQWYCHTCQAYKQPAAATPQAHPQAQPHYQQPAQQPHAQPQYQPHAQHPHGQPQHQAHHGQQPQPVHHQQPAQHQYQQQSAAHTQYQQPAQQPQYHQQPQTQYQTPAQQAPPQYQAQPPMSVDLVCRIEQAPSFSVLIFTLKPGQKVLTEKGAMMYMHNTIDIETHGRKGGLTTALLGGESFFVNTYTATRGAGELALVGPTMGDIKALDTTSTSMILQSGAFLASYPTVTLDTKWQGLKGFLSERDFVMLRASGPGKVWVASFGAIIEKDLQPGEVLSVDTGHLVAFPDTMQFSVRRVGNWKSTILSGEGLVTDLVGPGKVLLQTRTIGAFAASLIPYLPDRK